MEYSKNPLTYDEQADLLISRGLRVNRETLIQILKNVNYYRLTGYLYPFRKNFGEKDKFLEGTSFSTVWRHYTFDRQLKLLLLDAIERIEIALRTRLVYYFVHSFGQFGYLNFNNFPYLKKDQYDNFCLKIKDELERSNEVFISHFFEKYGDKHEMPPLWIVCELFSFGQLLTFYRGVSKEIKRELSRDLKIPDVVLFSWLICLNNIRNLCAHHARVWNKNFKIKLPTNKDKYPEWFSISRSEINKLFVILTVLKYLLKITAPNSKWHKRLYNLLDEYRDIPLENMGFPESWKMLSFWRE